MINAKPFTVGLRTYQNEAKAITPFVIKQANVEQTAQSDGGAYKTTEQLSAKGEIYVQRMWWA